MGRGRKRVRSAAPATVSLDGRSGSFTQEQRQVLASAPLAFLPTEDVIAYYAQPADRATINLNQTAERAPPHLNNQTVAAVAAKVLRATWPTILGRGRSPPCARAFWWFGATAPFNDAPRRDPELVLSKEDREFLKNMIQRGGASSCARSEGEGYRHLAGTAARSESSSIHAVAWRGG